MGKERSFIANCFRRYHYFVYKGERQIRYPKTAGKWIHEEHVIIAEDQDQVREIFCEEVRKLPFSLPARIKKDLENGRGWWMTGASARALPFFSLLLLSALKRFNPKGPGPSLFRTRKLAV